MILMKIILMILMILIEKVEARKLGLQHLFQKKHDKYDKSIARSLKKNVEILLPANVKAEIGFKDPTKYQHLNGLIY